MNFYKHHIGDYDSATAHISWDEDCAYNRLMRAYYRTEHAIPDAQKYRLTRAASRAQRAAIDAVLNEFFELKDGCWHNKRCNEEIAAYQAQAATNRRIARSRKGLPAFDDSLNEALDESCHEPLNESSTNHTPNHKPDTRTKNQEPEEPKTLTPLSGCAPDVPLLEPSKPPNGYRSQALEVLEFLNAKTGRHYRPVAANLNLIVARLRDGTSTDDLRSVIAKKCREWSGDAKMAEYLRPATLFNATKFAQYEGELKHALP